MKITLRKINKSHAGRIEKILSNKAVLKMLDSEHPFPIPKDYVSNKIEVDKKNWKERKAYKFVMICKNNVVGQISLYNPNKSKDSYEIGYFVGKDFWNKGIATEAVKQILIFSKRKLNLKKVWAKAPKNSSSEKVLIKNGFKKRGGKFCFDL